MGFRRSEPRKRLMFEITQAHCEIAVQNDPCNCVIAQAFHDKFGDGLAAINVLPTRTKLIFSDGRIHRYCTPSVLRDALSEFDRTKHWNLPEGVYYLLPIPKSESADKKREQSRMRRAKGDPAYNVKYEFSGRGQGRPLNARNIKLRNMMKSTLDNDNPPPPEQDNGTQPPKDDETNSPSK